MARRTDDDDIPRLPRGRGLSFSFGEILRIAVVATLLLAIIVLQKPCAKSVSKFVTSFGQVDAGAAPPDATAIPTGVILRADMTPAEQAAAIAAARGQAVDAGAAVLDAGAAASDAAAP